MTGTHRGGHAFGSMIRLTLPTILTASTPSEISSSANRRAVDDEDVPYEVGVAYYREIARGQIRGDTTGRLKIIFPARRERFGRPHYRRGRVGNSPLGQAVLILKGTVIIRHTVFNYPTLAE